MLFSERMGITQPKLLQIDSMDADLRNSLWNIFVDMFSKTNAFEVISEDIWKNFLKKPTDELPKFESNVIRELKPSFLKDNYYVVYDLIEFIIKSLKKHNYQTEVFVKKCKIVLEREKSAYKLINDQLIPISSEIEVQEIEQSLENSQNDKLKLVNNQLNTAIEHFKNRENADYRNSIKESISAVEGLCRLITGESTLGDALNKIDDKIQINPQFKDGLRKIYAFTNSKEGIRHAQMLDSNIGFDEAKFMLVFCSAFINYLISKWTDPPLLF